MKKTEKLASIGSPALIRELPQLYQAQELPHLEKIIDLLKTKNGFYAFESALHVFPLGSQPGVMDITEWNSEDLWRSAYSGIIDGITFFAEDVFGYQFGIGDAGVVHFNPEDASMQPLAEDIEGWAQSILENYDELTGYPVAHAWQAHHGALQEGRRLVFKIPLILGGEADVNNVGNVDAIEGMCGRGYIYNQIRDLPDGTPIRLNVTD